MLAAPDDLRDYRDVPDGRARGAAPRRGAALPARGTRTARGPTRCAPSSRRKRRHGSRPRRRRGSRAREYVVDLPEGPHADAARALLVLFDEHQGDVETLTLLADARRTAAMLDYRDGRDAST